MFSLRASTTGICGERELVFVKLKAVKKEHEKFCSETVERASCIYCYCKIYEQSEEGEVLTPEAT